MRKKSRLTAIIAIILCIPLVFITYFAVTMGAKTIALEGVYQIELTMPDGTLYRFDSKDDVSFFCDLLIDAKETAGPVRKEVADEKPMSFVYIDTGDRQRFDFYPALNLDGCVVKEEKGGWYLLSRTAASLLLCRSECLYLYTPRMVPSLCITGGGVTQNIAPAEYDWQYRKVDGLYYADRSSETYKGSVAHIYSDLKGETEFSLGLDGGSFEVTFATQDGPINNINSLSDLDFATDTYLDVTVEATWGQTTTSEYYGSAKYSFRLLYDIPATMHLSRTKVTAGGFVGIQLDNCSDDEHLVMKTDILDREITIYDGFEGGKFAIIPVPIDTDEGSYSVEISALGKVIETREIEVAKFTGGASVILSETEEEYNAMLSPEIIKAAGEQLMNAPTPEGYEACYPFGSAFKYPVPGSADGAFGDKYMINTSSATYQLPGAMYRSGYGTEVTAAQRGVVVFSRATAATGNTVIIDHGYGIRTYYFNLSSITVNDGDLVNAGSIIGNTGKSGFTWSFDKLLNVAKYGGDMFQFAVSVDEIFVDNTLFSAKLAFRE